MVIDDVVQVVGRGTIFIVDLIKNGYTEVGYIHTIPISIGDTVEHGGETYEVTGIEAWKIFDSYYKSTIGLKVKKINNMSVKRILENQLHLHDEGNPAWGMSGLPSNFSEKLVRKDIVNKPKTFIEELKGLNEQYVSPKLEDVKAKLRLQAKSGNKMVTFKSDDIDLYVVKWLKDEGLTVEDSWSGSRDDGHSIVIIKW